MNIKRTLSLLALSVVASSVVSAQEVVDESTITLTDRMGWYGPTACPEDLTAEHVTVQSEKMRLSFFGWSPEDDFPFTLNFPTDKSFRRCILEYQMSGSPRPAEWDMLTEVQVYNPSDGLWYEISRMITPYGGSFASSWKRSYFYDVTEFLPLLQQPDGTNFRIYYGGFDATEQRAHAATLTFHMFEGTPEQGPVVFTSQVYDSFCSGNNGYRAWAYGVQGHSIEADERLGERNIAIPENVHSGWLRVCFTGHGQEALSESGDSYATTMPMFPNREGYKVNNPAEFDKNTYTIFLHGQQVETVGTIWEVNTKNYVQAGTYKYNRAGWGPGKPGNVHWWYVENLPAGGTWNINIDLEEYISNRTAPNGAYVANYYVSATLFGLEKATDGIREITMPDASGHECKEHGKRGCSQCGATPIYNMQGQRITEPLAGGIYICNGKKTIMK